MSKAPNKKKQSVSIQNRKAFHEYHVLETYKAGLVLTGTEVKSIRLGKASLNEAHARVDKGELFLYGMHISPYEQGTHYNHQPDRIRKLLLTRREINRLMGKVKESGLTLIPLRVYFERCWVKVDLGLCKGKQLHDKRDAIMQKDAKRQIDRVMKQARLHE